MARKWTKWVVGVTGVTTFAVALGLVQMNKQPSLLNDETNIDSLLKMEKEFQQNSVLADTLSQINRSQFLNKAFFSTLDYEKSGLTQAQIEQYMQKKEKALATLEWGEDIVRDSSQTNPPVNRKTRSSR